MYLHRAGEEDREMAEGWKEYADGMLVFVSLRALSQPSRIMQRCRLVCSLPLLLHCLQ